MPATTIVAAWMSADTGVGPAMASGSQVWRMNWPDLDITAASRHSDATTSAVWLTSPVLMRSLRVSVSKVPPAAKNRIDTPTSSPMSPTRLVKKALRAASEFSLCSHQWPISTNEHTPTSSQPTIICSRLSLRTKNSMAAVNRLRNEKKWV